MEERTVPDEGGLGGADGGQPAAGRPARAGGGRLLKERSLPTPAAWPGLNNRLKNALKNGPWYALRSTGLRRVHTRLCVCEGADRASVARRW